MILEEKVTEVMREMLPKISRNVKWDGMYDNIAKRIVKVIKEELVK